MPSACPSPISSRPSTSTAKLPPVVTQRPPDRQHDGPDPQRAPQVVGQEEPERNVGGHPRKAERSRDDAQLQSASAALFAMSGKTAGKAPLATRLEKVVRQSRAVRDVTRPFNHHSSTAKCQHRSESGQPSGTLGSGTGAPPPSVGYGR